MRLLLVEDDTMIGEVVLDLLRAEHYAVDWVKDGQLALSALADGDYACVLLDLGLPDGSGLDLLTDVIPHVERTYRVLPERESVATNASLSVTKASEVARRVKARAGPTAPACGIAAPDRTGDSGSRGGRARRT